MQIPNLTPIIFQGLQRMFTIQSICSRRLRTPAGVTEHHRSWSPLMKQNTPCSQSRMQATGTTCWCCLCALSRQRISLIRSRCSPFCSFVMACEKRKINLFAFSFSAAHFNPLTVDTGSCQSCHVTVDTGSLVHGQHRKSTSIGYYCYLLL